MQRRSHQDILLLIARERASPNVQKNFHVKTGSLLVQCPVPLNAHSGSVESWLT